MCPDAEKAIAVPQPHEFLDAIGHACTDPLPVKWDGDDDPMHPQNWPKRLKWTTTILVSAFSFDTMMTSTMVAPALPQVTEDLNVPSQTIMQLVLSSYVLAYAFGPFLFAPLSEIYGRVPVLQVASTWFLGWNMTCGFARSSSLLVVGRVLSGIGGSAALSISSGMLSDCWRPEQRGRSLAVYSFIPLLGPTIGPILGGIITEKSTWRWAFWSTSAFNACLQILALLLLRETHPPTLLRQKTRRLRSAPSQTRWNGAPIKDVLLCALRRPFYLLGTQHVILLLAIFAGVSFGTMYLVLSVLPYLFTQQYHQSSLIAGLNFVSLGIGFAVGAQTLAYSTDLTYRRRASTESPKPELRLILLLPSVIAASLGLLCLGCSAQAQTHWIVPNIGIVVFGAGTQFSTQCINAYVIDVYGPLEWSASAMAGIWALKSVAGFGFPLFGPGIIHVLGWGWASSILATGLLAVGIPIGLNLTWHGEVFRRVGERKLKPRG